MTLSKSPDGPSITNWDNIISALGYLIDKKITLPKGESRNTIMRRVRGKADKAHWDSFQWNPDNDSQASPKPTWQEIEVAYQKYWMTLNVFNTDRTGISPWLFKRPFESIIEDMPPADISHEDNKLHVGSGIDHMGALSFYLQDNLSAGSQWPLVVMRNENNTQSHLWTQDSGRLLLKYLSDYQNKLESAKNILRARLETYAQNIFDGTGGLPAAASEQAKFNASIKQYKEMEPLVEGTLDHTLRRDVYPAMQKEMLSIMQDLVEIIPPTPELARPHFKDIITAYATKRQKQILMESSQQGMTLPSSCIQQDDALKELVVKKNAASIALDNAAEIAAMEEIADNFAIAVDKIKVLATPDFYDRGSQGLQKVDYPIVISWVPLTSTSQHYELLTLEIKTPPEHPNVGINTELNGVAALSGSPFQTLTSPLSDDSSLPVFYINQQGVNNNPPAGLWRLNIQARNECGPQTQIIDIEVPSIVIKDGDFSSLPGDWAINGTYTQNNAKGIIADGDSKVEIILMDRINIIQKARYDIDIDMTITTGDREATFYVNFFDKDNAVISAADLAYDPVKYPKGWHDVVGSNFVFAVTNTQAQLLDKFPIGGIDPGGRKIPIGARSFSINAVLNGSGTTTTHSTLSKFSVNELTYTENWW